MQFVVDSFDLMAGGELYVPRIPSMKITDLAQAIAPGATMHDVGLRPGEKLHEEMISPEEGRRALALGDRYVVQPDLARWGYRRRRPTACPSRTASSTAPTATTSGTPASEIAEIVAAGI